MPKVSVVIPCYNHGKYIMEAIHSINAQTFTDWEIIVVNDGSSDQETIDILNGIQNRSTRVLHKPNGHLSSARNHGFKNATGEYVLALDADDWFKPSYLSKAVAVMDKDQSVGVVTCYMQCFGASKQRWKPLGGSIENFLYRTQCTASSLIRRSAWEMVGGYDENMKLGLEDWEFWIRVTSSGWEVAVIPEFLFYYRITGKSMSDLETTPNKPEIIDYMVNKHRDLYLSEIKKAMVARKIFDFRKVKPYRFS